jgi:tRNA 2-thiouridine synthesizing protein A
MAEIKPDAVLDVRGEVCPYPFIRTKWKMDRIKSGEILKVMSNDPDSFRNIDAWTKRSGDLMLEVENEESTVIIY